jgi:hypothetical protein
MPMARCISRLLVAATAAVLVGCGGSSGDSPTGQPPVAAVATVGVAAPTTTVNVGDNLQLVATTRDQSGATLNGHTVLWATSSSSVASVSTGGLVTGVSAGSATITATSEGKTGAVAITVTPRPPRDFAVVGAQFTQGVQDATGSIPMVLSGNAAAVNVLIRATPPTSTPMQVVLRLFNAAGTLIRADTTVTSGTLGASPSYAAPSVQFLVPAATLQAGLRWQIARDPRGLVVDDTASDDVFPAAAPATLATVDVPTVNIRFVPIVLASNNNATGVVNDALIPEYLRTFKSIYPVGQINAHVGTPFTTTASFGTPPSGGDATFWTQVLAELDLARTIDPTEPTSNWYGVIVPPAGFNFTAFGGFSYIPTSGTAVGPHTRTSTGVQLNWFNRPTQARDLVAHEIGHTFGRAHAPCGAAGAPLDASFPIPGGTLDLPGHDVFSWATGLASSATTVPTTTGDVMGYCFPVWASTYTYRAILNFRQTQVVAALANEAAAPITRVLIVRGSMEIGRSMKLEPAFALNARPALPDHPGPYRVDGLAADGRVLFSYAFEPAVLDHAPNVRHFTLAIPITPDVEESLDALRLVGPPGETRMTRAVPATRVLSGGRATAVRGSAGALSVLCGDVNARGVLVLDGATGSALGSAPAASVRAVVGAARPLTVLCSDGVRTTRSNVTVPN